MKKFFTFFAMLFVVISFGWAQTTVQGIPHPYGHASIKATASSDDNNQFVDFDKIQFWTGAGPNKAALVIKWNDTEGTYHAFVWGYRFDGEATGYDMIVAIAKADPNLFLLTQFTGPMGYTVDGIGYGESSTLKFLADSARIDKRIMFGYDTPNTTMGQTTAPGADTQSLADASIRTGLNDNNGVISHPFDQKTYGYPAYDYDWWKVDASPYSLWGAGWYKGYWSYWVKDDVDDDFAYSGLGASSRQIEDGAVDGWSYCADMTGMTGASINGTYTYVPATGSILPTRPDENKYAKGVFVVNEDWYGHNNSTLNFLDAEGQWHYRVIQEENPGVQLGCTNQYGQIYGDKFYLIAKQDKDPGATISGGRITIADAFTLKVEKQYPTINPDATKSCDGRSFLGVDENKGYIGTSNGVWVLDLNTQEVTKQVSGSGNPNTDSYGSLYKGQIGSMVRCYDRVFAAHQQKGCLVIDTKTDCITDTLTLSYNGKEYAIGSVVLGHDGNVWLSVATNTSGMGGAEPYLVKVNPLTLEEEWIKMPDGINGPANSWYAWTPDGFCADPNKNVLYWNGGNSSWFSAQTIYRYDIDTNQCKLLIDLTSEGYYLYGCSMRVDPVSGNMYASIQTNGQYGNEVTLRVYNTTTGEIISAYPLITQYWFPSLPVFPDIDYPVFTLPSTVLLTDANLEYNTREYVTDADNNDAAIVLSVESVSNPGMVEVELVGNKLTLHPGTLTGTCDIVLKANSNGHITRQTLTVSNTSSVNNVNIDEEDENTPLYNISGQRVSKDYRGIVIKKGKKMILK